MKIQVFNIQGYQISLPPQIKSSLQSFALEADKSAGNWQEITDKMMRVLEVYGFEVEKIQPVIKYYETKISKEILSIEFQYSDY